MANQLPNTEDSISNQYEEKENESADPQVPLNKEINKREDRGRKWGSDTKAVEQHLCSGVILETGIIGVITVTGKIITEETGSFYGFCEFNIVCQQDGFGNESHCFHAKNTGKKEKKGNECDSSSSNGASESLTETDGLNGKGDGRTKSPNSHPI